jgi:hypothetical protein
MPQEESFDLEPIDNLPPNPPEPDADALVLERVEDAPGVIDPKHLLHSRPVVGGPAAAPRERDLRQPQPGGGLQQGLLIGAVFLGVFGGCFLATTAFWFLAARAPAPPSTAQAVAWTPSRVETAAPIIPSEPEPPIETPAPPPPVERPAPSRPSVVVRPKEPQPAPPPIDPLTALLTDVKGADPRRRQFALMNLANRAPEAARRQEVITALVNVVSDPALGSPQSTEAAFNTWATTANTPTLLKLLGNSDEKIRAVGINVLGTLKDPKATEALVALLPKDADRGRVAVALKKIGPSVESSLWLPLNNNDPQVRAAVCHILKDVGTIRSFGPLQQHLNDSDFFVRVAAQQALEASKKR